jgi:hypothetical protein
MLRQRPQHRYDIKKDIERALGGTVSLNNKTLYLTLKRFEEIGAVTWQAIAFHTRRIHDDITGLLPGSKRCRQTHHEMRLLALSLILMKERNLLPL